MTDLIEGIKLLPWYIWVALIAGVALTIWLRLPDIKRDVRSPFSETIDFGDSDADADIDF